MTTRSLNLLNIGLMIISCIVAFIIPFELFLFSYAILGPLHYLTEISWLHKRNYFVEGKYDYLWLILLCVFGTFGYFGMKGFNAWNYLTPFIALISALAFYLIKNRYLKILCIFFAFLIAVALKSSQFYIIFFIVFLPTILHVFVFTGSFILYGAIKSKSVSAFISLAVFVVCALSFFYIQPDFSNYIVGDYIKNSYKDFSSLNHYLLNVFQLEHLAEFDQKSFSIIFNSENGYKVMRFIAFAYTYHYLNWFSKTSIIKWHQVEKKYLWGTLAVWLIAIGIYAKDYETGLKFLFFLSVLHVFLEFPLNFKTFIDIGKEVKGAFIPAKVQTPISNKQKQGRK